MEKERKTFRAFMDLYSKQAPFSEDGSRRATLMFAEEDGSLSRSSPLISFTLEDALEVLDKESELVRWLLNQINTHDPYTEKVVGLIFNPKTVLSEVMKNKELRG